MAGNYWIKWLALGFVMLCAATVFSMSQASAATGGQDPKAATAKSKDAAAQKPAAQKKAGSPAAASKALPAGISKDPYIGAIVVDTRDGKVLFEDSADAACYPASLVKLMNLLVLEDHIARGALKRDDPVTATVDAARMGGTQVWLKENEVFPAEELIYAMMVESANDAATALAVHVAGSTEAFVRLMNEKARALGMKSTRFASVHGLPPSKDRAHDLTTARDLATLGLALLKYPQIIEYTSVKERPFRNGTFTLRSHNHLLGNVPGVDGLKTGYFREGGFSIVVTGEKNGARLVSVVVGSRDRLVRDQQAGQLLAKGFVDAPPGRAQAAVAQDGVHRNPGAPAADAQAPAGQKPEKGFDWGMIGVGLAGIAVGVLIGFAAASRNTSVRRT